MLTRPARREFVEPKPGGVPVRRRECKITRSPTSLGSVIKTRTGRSRRHHAASFVRHIVTTIAVHPYGAGERVLWCGRARRHHVCSSHGRGRRDGPPLGAHPGPAGGGAMRSVAGAGSSGGGQQDEARIPHPPGLRRRPPLLR